MYKIDGWVAKDLQEHHGHTHINKETGTKHPRTKCFITVLRPLLMSRCLRSVVTSDLNLFLLPLP